MLGKEAVIGGVTDRSDSVADEDGRSEISGGGGCVRMEGPRVLEMTELVLERARPRSGDGESSGSSIEVVVVEGSDVGGRRCGGGIWAWRSEAMASSRLAYDECGEGRPEVFWA